MPGYSTTAGNTVLTGLSAYNGVRMAPSAAEAPITPHAQIIGGDLPPLGQFRVGPDLSYKPVKYWTGSAWVVKPLKYWNGTAWVLS